jgi:hypothetical protein
MLLELFNAVAGVVASSGALCCQRADLANRKMKLSKLATRWHSPATRRAAGRAMGRAATKAGRRDKRIGGHGELVRAMKLLLSPYSALGPVR